jgi:hypothetical protein
MDQGHLVDLERQDVSWISMRFYRAILTDPDNSIY